MAIKLGELLVTEGAITRKQLDEALKCQVIFGGRLGTNLVEMGFIDEQKLVEYLSKQLEVPYASSEQLMSVPADVIKLISKDLAVEYKLIPLSLDKKKLSVAIWDPSDLSAIDAISFITGYIIRPLVCSELRLLMALEHYYGVKREVRYIQMKGGTGTRTRDAESETPGGASPEDGAHDDSPFKELMGELPPPPASGKTESSWGDLAEVPPPERVPGPLLKTEGSAPRPAALPVEEPDIIEFAEPTREIRPILPPQQKPAPPPAAVGPEEAKTASPDTLLARLAEAGNKDAIADALVGYLGRDFERVALFMVKGRIVAGWRGVLHKKPIAGFDHFQVPLDEPTLLNLVMDTKNFYFGPILATPGNAKIVAGLGGGQPDSALLIPVIMMERVVTVFYVDGEKELLGKKLFELQKIIGKVALAFEILILKNKILLV
jgi:hypothetical protein